jgi:hypothetical protein
MLNNNKDEYIEFFRSPARITGLTHNFYRYPARFSPQFVRDTILKFSKEGDLVLDAFVGSGTTIVEAIANGRNAIGIDINPLAHFITNVKTTPLSLRDRETILSWVNAFDFCHTHYGQLDTSDDGLKNVPEEMKGILINAAKTVSQLEFPRQRRFARCALLRFGQWAIDCRKGSPSWSTLKDQLVKQVTEMLEGLDELVYFAKSNGIPKNQITSKRKLYTGTISELIRDENFGRLQSKTRLVLTSPPYPGVHVLYHRWQVNGRRETPAPYWLAGLRNGHGESYYTLGGRSISGLNSYFTKVREIFSCIRSFIHPDALVVQLVAFSDPKNQLPAFLNAMNLAGYEELMLFCDSNLERPIRKVPNRKWYTYSEKNQHASNEILLFHRPCW